MLGTSARPEGITNPPIDDLLKKVDSKYGLVVEAAKRARQINTYIRQLEKNQNVIRENREKGRSDGRQQV